MYVIGKCKAISITAVVQPHNYVRRKIVTQGNDISRRFVVIRGSL